VHDARANGHSWDEIARALATTPAEARPRFHPQSPVADAGGPTTPDPAGKRGHFKPSHLPRISASRGQIKPS
jgi:hypothetical protein